MKRTGRYRVQIIVGWIVLALGCGLLLLFNTSITVPQWLSIALVSGIGLGSLFVTPSQAAQASVADEHGAIAGGLTPFFRAVGQALGIVVCNTVLQNELRRRLQLASDPELRSNANSLAKNYAIFPDIARTMPDPIKRAELLLAFDQSLHAIWWTLFAFALLGGVASLFIVQCNPERFKRIANGGKGPIAELGQQLDDIAPDQRMTDQDGQDESPPTHEDVSVRRSRRVSTISSS